MTLGSSNTLIIFCRNCKEVIGQTSPHCIPQEFKCPKCGAKDKLRYRRHWTGKLHNLESLTAMSSRSQAGVRILDDFGTIKSDSLREK